MKLFRPGRTGVKICGITSEQDARMCVDAGADALGFNFYEGSSRYLEPAKALDWIRDLQGIADRIAVVVNPDPRLLRLLVEADCFEMVQFHGDETPQQCEEAGFANWMRAMRIGGGDGIAEIKSLATAHILLDANSSKGYGGTGELADWGLAAEIVAALPAHHIALAGGLRPGNVAEAIRRVRPAAVDVAGGVESSPGKKDPFLARDFVAAVRGC
jgi:phosphoribosylanthranilate isomerase